ncbi:nucleotidyltransferase family protein [Variovorax sp. RCC_210]|uniref:nucleotidyltransferase family protein n=1 Tax=Variovorax sp. RCC_210 TaxID=3239217 RepID=UPI0035261F9E
MTLTATDFVAQALQDPANAALLERLPALGLPQGFLTAGSLFQATWNRVSGKPPGWGVKDYDVFYFDDSDLSWDAEDAVIRRVHDAVADLGVTVEVKNQARVHLWYEARFKSHYPRLRSARDGIDRYLIACTRVGIALADQTLHAPDGLDDLAAGVLRMNPLLPMRELFLKKAGDYQARWPWLQVVQPETTRADEAATPADEAPTCASSSPR